MQDWQNTATKILGTFADVLSKKVITSKIVICAVIYLNLNIKILGLICMEIFVRNWVHLEIVLSYQNFSWRHNDYRTLTYLRHNLSAKPTSILSSLYLVTSDFYYLLLDIR